MVTRGHSWSLVVTRGHSWSLVVIRGHSWSFVVTRGHSCVLLDKILQWWLLFKWGGGGKYSPRYLRGSGVLVFD
jgi:hypothetical protein